MELDVKGPEPKREERASATELARRERSAGPGFHFRTESGALANTDDDVYGRRNVGMKDHCFDAGGRKSGGAEFLTDLPSIGIQERVVGEEVRRIILEESPDGLRSGERERIFLIRVPHREEVASGQF